jgi:hypothetical protein
MPRCSFFTAAFTQCTRTAHDGTGHCWTHTAKAQQLGPRAEGTCPCVVGNHWCGRERQELRLTVAELVEAYMLEEPRPTWRTVTDLVIARMMLPHTDPLFLPEMTALNVARRFYLLTARQEEMGPHDFRDHWFGMPPAVALPPPPPVAGLGQLAEDVQNVHTAVVVKQTNTNVELLLEAGDSAPPGDDPMRWASIWWLQKPSENFQEYLRVIDDVNHWFNKRTCKSTGDWLYKRVFTGVIAKLSVIGDEELRGELVKRLWQECWESLGMCCEGHIGRLANVFVGFDENFKSPASPNEMLQTRLAEIAQLKLRPETKLAKAKDVMDELGIPEAERAPWLEALEE